jgi:CHAT domain-containing protein
LRPQSHRRERRGLGEPSLALTLPKQPTELDDGLLTASEAAQLKLNAGWGAAVGLQHRSRRQPGAQARSGLARAFFFAGARALLVSHWSVDSEAHTRLTPSTFAIIKADPQLRRRAPAQRDAGLADPQGEPDQPYPAFWAPFSIIGEGQRDERQSGHAAIRIARGRPAPQSIDAPAGSRIG